MQGCKTLCERFGFCARSVLAVNYSCANASPKLNRMRKFQGSGARQGDGKVKAGKAMVGGRRDAKAALPLPLLWLSSCSTAALPLFFHRFVVAYPVLPTVALRKQTLAPPTLIIDFTPINRRSAAELCLPVCLKYQYLRNIMGQPNTQ